MDYNHFKNYYKMIGIDLSKQHALDVDAKATELVLLGNQKKKQKYFTLLKKQKKQF